MNGGWGGKEMGSIHSEREGRCWKQQWMWGTAQAELLSPGIEGRSEGQRGDLFPCLQAEGKVANSDSTGWGV